MSSRLEKLLADVDQLPLTSSLQKVIRLAVELKDDEFEDWARCELHGYWENDAACRDDSVVPIYREVTGDWIDDAGRCLRFTDDKMAFTHQVRVRYSVTELEGLAHADGPLACAPPGLLSIMRNDLGLNVAMFRFSPIAVRAILSAIQTELSDRLEKRRPAIEALPSDEAAPASARGMQLPEVPQIPYEARVVRVIIASPGDVTQER